MKQEKIYIALVSTPGIFAWIIRRVTKRDYIHVVLSLDENLKEAYSVGRRNPFIPFFAGFEKENAPLINRAFPTARYRIYSLDCSPEQKRCVAVSLRECYRKRFRYHYCIVGLPFILMNKPFYQRAHYTCSSFLAHLLEHHGMKLFDKHFSLVTPADFLDYKTDDILFEGNLSDFLAERRWTFKSCGITKGALYEV